MWLLLHFARTSFLGYNTGFKIYTCWFLLCHSCEGKQRNKQIVHREKAMVKCCLISWEERRQVAFLINRLNCTTSLGSESRNCQCIAGCFLLSPALFHLYTQVGGRSRVLQNQVAVRMVSMEPFVPCPDTVTQGFYSAVRLEKSSRVIIFNRTKKGKSTVLVDTIIIY